jgi:hypothetical protein
MGCAALLATLALSLPGVQIARAGENVASVASAIEGSGPSCEPQPVAYQPPIRIVLPKTAAAKQDPNSVPVALNNRGYSYGALAEHRPVDPKTR